MEPGQRRRASHPCLSHLSLPSPRPLPLKKMRSRLAPWSPAIVGYFAVEGGRRGGGGKIGGGGGDGAWLIPITLDG